MRSFLFNLWVLSGLATLSLMEWVLQEPAYRKSKAERGRPAAPRAASRAW